MKCSKINLLVVFAVLAVSEIRSSPASDPEVNNKEQTLSDDWSNPSCTFPFVYKGVEYKTCTNVEYGDKMWCSFDAEYNGNWADCYQLSDWGHSSCVFPFVYKGVEYTTCTNIEYGDELWCSFDAEYNGTWADCLQFSDWGHSSCVFPFIYKGVEYETCTNVEYGDKMWCSFDAVYNGTWADCFQLSGRSKCVFPFTYKGVTYTGCTTVDAEKPWCAYNTNYIRSRWEYCKDPQDWEHSDCVFPFTYEGVEYDRCTNVDYGNNMWCSLDAQYDGNWTDCYRVADEQENE